MHELRGFQRDLLFVVCGLQQPSGREIVEEMGTSLSQNVHPPRIYTNLDELVERDLLEKGRKDGRTNRYELTEEGRRTLEARHEWEREHLETDACRGR